MRRIQPDCQVDGVTQLRRESAAFPLNWNRTLPQVHALFREDRCGLPDSTAKKTHRPIIGGERFVLLPLREFFSRRRYEDLLAVWCTSFWKPFKIGKRGEAGGWDRCVGRILIGGVFWPLQVHPCGFWMMEYIPSVYPIVIRVTNQDRSKIEMKGINLIRILFQSYDTFMNFFSNSFFDFR